MLLASLAGLGKILKGALKTALIAIVGIVAMFALTFFLVATYVRFTKEEFAGDRIMKAANGRFIGRVVDVSSGYSGAVLRIHSAGGDFEVSLAEVGLVPPEIGGWHEKALRAIRSEVLGADVEVFSHFSAASSGFPIPGHVVYRDNRWLNGYLVEEGFCYVTKTPAPTGMAQRGLRSLQRDAHSDKKGLWNDFTRKQARAFPHSTL